MRRYVGQCCSVKRGTLLVEWREAWSWRPNKKKKKRQHKCKNTKNKSPKRSGGSSAVNTNSHIYDTKWASQADCNLEQVMRQSNCLICAHRMCDNLTVQCSLAAPANQPCSLRSIQQAPPHVPLILYTPNGVRPPNAPKPWKNTGFQRPAGDRRKTGGRPNAPKPLKNKGFQRPAGDRRGTGERPAGDQTRQNQWKTMVFRDQRETSGRPAGAQTRQNHWKTLVSRDWQETSGRPDTPKPMEKTGFQKLAGNWQKT